jgi:hypothetical protein
MTLTKSHLATALCTVLLCSTALSIPANSDTSGVHANRSVEGVWMVTITPRNCVTGLPIPGAAFESLFTFHKGGTMSVWAQNAVISFTRSPSHGLWIRDRGWSDYALSFIHLRYDGSGYFAGKQVAHATLALSESGDEFTTDSVNTFFDADGNPQGSGCANGIGTRFHLDP